MAMQPSRRWLILTALGAAFVVVAMIVALLAVFDKPHFGGMVGSAFLMIITSGVMVGSIMMLIGTFMLPERKTWRGIVLIVWALIGLTSPLFGFLFLGPWAVMGLMLPVVIVVLVQLFGRAGPV